MWTLTTRAQHSRAGLRYGSDLTEAEWLILSPFLPAPRPCGGHDAIERMFCRLKDFRRIATRYDNLAANFLSAIYLAAAVSCWL